MKSKKIMILLLSLFSNNVFLQTNEIINPKGKWFFGAEIGANTIISYGHSEKISVQGGFLAEYYFARNWSINGRIKYFETGAINKGKKDRGFFEGAVISVPLNVTFKYPIVKNFSGNVKFGLALNQEVKSNYYNYPANQITDYSKTYVNFNPGIGFNYFISKNTALYFNYEIFILGNDRGHESDFFIIIPRLPNSPDNQLFNFGVKYNFNK